jgi:hypothetical protein
MNDNFYEKWPGKENPPPTFLGMEQNPAHKSLSPDSCLGHVLKKPVTRPLPGPVEYI